MKLQTLQTKLNTELHNPAEVSCPWGRSLSLPIRETRRIFYGKFKTKNFVTNLLSYTRNNYQISSTINGRNLNHM